MRKRQITLQMSLARAARNRTLLAEGRSLDGTQIVDPKRIHTDTRLRIYRINEFCEWLGREIDKEMTK